MTDITADTVKELLARGAADMKQIPTPDGGFAVVLPVEHELKLVPPVEKPLQRIAQRVSVTSRDSFCGYLQTFKDARTRVFVQSRAAGNAVTSFVAHIDYHMPDQPDRLAHSVTFTPRYSEQWVRWRDAQKAAMTQREFAEFIEENRLDITEPAGAQMLDIVSKFKATKKVEYDSVVYQTDGSVMIAYSDKIESARGAGFEVPSQMKLAMPVFFKGTPYEVPVLVRYRMDDGGVRFSIKIDRMDYIEADAVDLMAQEVAEQTGVPVLMGSVN